MAHTSAKSPQDQAGQRIEEEALRVAKSIQTPGQTKEQTRLIAKGIEKGIALYKQQQSAKLRERDKLRKKAIRERAAARDEVGARADDAGGDENMAQVATARLALGLCAGLFALAAVGHLVRYLLGWALVVGPVTIAPEWSVLAVVVAAAAAAWLVLLVRRLA